MSMEIDPDPLLPDVFSGGSPELSALGKRIEMLRIERGLSKQVLARTAGTSRQQLWRVMTGKSELTVALCQRLAEALRVDAALLRSGEGGWSPSTTTSLLAPPAELAISSEVTLAGYVADAARVERTLSSLPAGESGRQLRTDVLDAIQRNAAAAGLSVAAEVAALRPTGAD